MKKIKYFLMAAICTLFASCMGNSYAETDETMPSPYGNNDLTENPPVASISFRFVQ